MPTTYLDTLVALQQRGLAAIKAAQDVQLAALRIMCDSAAAPDAGLPFTRSVTESTLGFAYQLAAQNAAFAQTLVEAFAPRTAVAQSGAQADRVIREPTSAAADAPAPAAPDTSTTVARDTPTISDPDVPAVAAPVAATIVIADTPTVSAPDIAEAPIDTLARMLPPPVRAKTIPSVSGNLGPKPVGKTKSKRSK